MTNILIFNAVPTNNGDAALVFSLYNKLIKKGYSVKIAAQRYSIVKKLYPDYPLVRELTDYRFFSKIPYNKYLRAVLTPFFFLFSREFMKANVLVASPGGYINSYYGFSRVAATFFIAKILGKKTAIYSQSIGPLNSKDRRLMRFMSKFIDVIYARDKYSFDLLTDLGIDSSKYFLVEDGAFLIPFELKKSQQDIIAISVREWKHDLRNREIYYSMIRSFVKTLVNKGYNVEFISTCQGLENYVDDSKVASEIVASLDDDLRDRIFINRSYYNLDDLLLYIGKFSAVIGTRLHMCILSMLRGKACLNISYEIKGKEAYSYLGLAKYSIDYNEDIISAEKKLDFFIETLPEKQKVLETIMTNQNIKAQMFFDNFLSLLKKS